MSPIFFERLRKWFLYVRRGRKRRWGPLNRIRRFYRPATALSLLLQPPPPSTSTLASHSIVTCSDESVDNNGGALCAAFPIGTTESRSTQLLVITCVLNEWLLGWWVSPAGWMDKDRPESASHRTMMLESFSVTLLQLWDTGRDNVL